MFHCKCCGRQLEAVQYARVINGVLSPVCGACMTSKSTKLDIATVFQQDSSYKDGKGRVVPKPSLEALDRQ